MRQPGHQQLAGHPDIRPARQQQPRHHGGTHGAAERPAKPVRRLGHRPLHGPFRLPIQVVHAPVTGGTAFKARLPRLVERFHHEVVQPLGLRDIEELAQERRLVHPPGLRAANGDAAARPADFTDHYLLARECFLHLRQLVHAERQCVVDLQPFPVRQQMDGDVIDGIRQLRVLQPHPPLFCRGNRHMHAGLHFIDILHQLRHRHVGAVGHLVAHQHALHIRVRVRGGDQPLYLGLVGGLLGVDPGAQRHLHIVVGGQTRNRRQVTLHGVGADMVRDAAGQLQVLPDFGLRRQLVGLRRFAAVIRAERHAAYIADIVRHCLRLVDRRPNPKAHGGGNAQCQQCRGVEKAMPPAGGLADAGGSVSMGRHRASSLRRRHDAGSHWD